MTAARDDGVLGLVQTKPASMDRLVAIHNLAGDVAGRLGLEHEVGVVGHLAHAGDELEQVGVVVEDRAGVGKGRELAADVGV